MRLLHTSDWHLGRSFHREDMLGAQARYVDHLVETVRSEGVDAVLVSGDLYDRALPPVDAVALCDEALRRLAAEKVQVVIISGNHDSAQRLGFGSGLMDAAGVHLRADPRSVGDPVVLGDGTAVYGIPYLEPEVVRSRWELPERGHTAALTEAMARVRADLATRGGRSVVLAHAFVTGGEASDSERDISVGGVASVPMSVFDGVDYVALGHLHGRQCMSETVRYSGSPLAYSFSEEHQVKGAWLVDLGETVRAEFVEAPVPRRAARVRGRLDDLLTGESWSAYEDHWLQVTLTDPARPAGAMDRLRRRFPHTLALAFEPDGGAAGDDRGWAERIRDRSEVEIAYDFVREVRGSAASLEERELLHEAFESFRRAEAGR
ncbi:exonuclease SbcCD subunit D [Actinoallomurus bryophytorum]|uniref:Nuclease SbcCD subunit D n=1 Tax=Actinoallomurus bryophytorum TaxID=1490222 RepID=A0A543CSK4_9ACTN|nr:exonuclease SbcCD subunit D [Actinoallomurus bryophytorum]TQM00093.1 exodeoxyribonuclease I subunit D [Actinoallomurus bryophytorum]